MSAPFSKVRELCAYACNAKTALGPGLGLRYCPPYEWWQVQDPSRPLISHAALQVPEPRSNREKIRDLRLRQQGLNREPYWRRVLDQPTFVGFQSIT